MNIKDNTMMIPVTILTQRVSDMLISAFEGGSNYWIDNIRLFDKNGKQVANYGDNPVDTLSSIIVVESGNEEETEHTLRMTLPPGDLEKGLKIMGDKYPRHFANFMSEDDDAETADVFLQCCLFGEIVYG